jgi:hypothetical protein
MNYQMLKIKQNLEISREFTKNQDIKAKINQKIKDLTLKFD